MTEKHISVPPDVARISEGLRDTGYDFNAAIADIIDNSIAADADKIHVRLEVDFADSVIISIADNGHGMDEVGIVNAMKYGSSKRPSAKSLGKFGLGLKTASTAYCRRLSVISRDSCESHALRATWDLDEMAARNSWDLEIAPADAAHLQLLNELASNTSGTVVLWESIDRISTPDNQPIRRAVEKLAAGLRDHIAIVFQRFLNSDDSRERNVDILLNGQPVLAWDPFCIAETKEPIAEKKMDVRLPDGTQTSFVVRAFVLPRKEEFSSDANRIAARVSNERQGLYVYRENRL